MDEDVIADQPKLNINSFPKRNRKKRSSFILKIRFNKKIRKLKTKLKYIKETWNSMPWLINREIENILLISFIIIIGFSFNFLLMQGAKAFMASLFKISFKWQSGKVLFTIPDTSSLWTYESVVLVYLSAPILLFISGISFLKLYSKLKKKSSITALIYLWGYLSALLFFYGTYIAGIFTNKGFGYVTEWLFIPAYIEIPIGFFFVFLIWNLGHKASRKFMAFSPSFRFTKAEYLNFYLKRSIF